MDDLKATLEWLEDLRATAGTHADILRGLQHIPVQEGREEPVLSLTWRERLWLVPSETRLGVGDVAEALARSKSWVYKRTMVTAEDRLPHRKLDGELQFCAGELRTWIREHEEIETSLPMTSTPAERRLQLLGKGAA